MKFIVSHLFLLCTSLVVTIVAGEETIIIPTTTTNNTTSHQNHRDLQCDIVAAYHPNYSLPWNQGKCELVATCNSPGYSTELECCKGAYAGQIDNYCISQLENPPTSQPTKVGGPDIFYPNYALSWPEGKCINTSPVPSGRPTYPSMLACCKAAYGGQMSGACIKALPNSPTGAPTKLGGGDYYPDYTLSWPEGKCINTSPVPSGRPTYTSMLACCKAAYGGQMSGACIKALPNPPTSAPTKLGSGVYYPDYTLSWPEGKCINVVPVPTGRPTYTTQVGCCQAAYAGQMSKVCMSSALQVPTRANPSISPTSTATPSNAPTTTNPSISPTTANPSNAPTTTNPSISPTTATPSNAPTTTNPSTAVPTTATPSSAPTTAAPTTATPTTAAPTVKCFPDKTSLQSAVNTYITNDCKVNTSLQNQACIDLANEWGYPIGNWCTSSVTDMSLLFYEQFTFNEDISGWDVGSVTTMMSMFWKARKFNQDISEWDVGSVKDMYGLFYEAAEFNQNIARWNVMTVTDMSFMFKGASVFNQNISSWTVGSVTNMSNMFEGALVFNQDISGWNIGSLTDIQSMFESASLFNQNLCAWKTKIPFITNQKIFFNSGCNFKNTPTALAGPFCAVNFCS